jgi:hypothetical protein
MYVFLRFCRLGIPDVLYLSSRVVVLYLSTMVCVVNDV